MAMKHRGATVTICLAGDRIRFDFKRGGKPKVNRLEFLKKKCDAEKKSDRIIHLKTYLEYRNQSPPTDPIKKQWFEQSRDLLDKYGIKVTRNRNHPDCAALALSGLESTGLEAASTGKAAGGRQEMAFMAPPPDPPPSGEDGFCFEDEGGSWICVEDD